MNIIELAKQAGLGESYISKTRKESGIVIKNIDCLERFADLVAAHEREECAKLVEPSEEHRRDSSWGYIGGTEGVELLDGLAAAIRARGTP